MLWDPGRKAEAPFDLLAIRGRDGTALVFAVLRGHRNETLSFAGVVALAVILDRLTGPLSLATVHTDALHLISAGALIGARIHGTGDKQHRHRTGDQQTLSVHFLSFLGSWNVEL